MTTDMSSRWVSFQSKSESRRDVLKTVVVAAAAPLVAAVPTSMEAYAKPVGGGLPPTEGVFLICEKEHRIFFIRSVYLPYFEVTDLYPTETKLQDIVSKGRNHARDKWRVLYSDDDDVPTEIVNNSEELAPPSPGKTYIAMSLSPTIT